MGKVYFLTQEATKDILLRVTSVCVECYSDIKLGDTIHYDMDNYRYLCDACQEEVMKNDKEETLEEENEIYSLF